MEELNERLLKAKKTIELIVAIEIAIEEVQGNEQDEL